MKKRCMRQYSSAPSTTRSCSERWMDRYCTVFPNFKNSCFQWADRPTPTEPKLCSKRTELKNFFANKKKMAQSLLSLFNFSSSVIFIICIKIREWKPGFSNEKVQTRSCTSNKTPPSVSFCLSLSFFLPHLYTSISSKHMHTSSLAVCEGWGDKLWFLISPPSLAIRKASRATKDEEN